MYCRENQMVKRKDFLSTVKGKEYEISYFISCDTRYVVYYNAHVANNVEGEQPGNLGNILGSILY